MSAADLLIDDVGTLIDEAIADPTQVDAVKAQIRARLAPVSIAPPHAEAEEEELWDNLPV
jgi:hypothetical protein